MSLISILNSQFLFYVVYSKSLTGVLNSLQTIYTVNNVIEFP